MTAEGKSRIYGILQSMVFCAFAAVVLLDRSTTVLPASPLTRAAGGALAGAGVIVMLVAIRTIGRSIQIAPAPKPAATLATHGIYRRLRHPIYTGILLIAAGLFLRQPTALVGVGTAAVIGFLVVKSRFEERLLLARYPEYADYRTRAWGVIPFF